MFKTFVFGVILGIGLAGAAAWLLPVADLTREASVISVMPNGGNAETFQIQIPDDRIVAASNDGSMRVPQSLQWPDVDVGVDVELFKIRNQHDVVVGVASRMASGDQGAVVEWAMHLPARGTLYFPLSAAPDATGFLTGALRAGTGEFLTRRGQLRESFTADPDDAGSGIIRLETTLVSTISDSGDES